MIVRKATINDNEQIFSLYKKLAIVPDGIIRNPSEITEQYVSNFLEESIDNGLILVAVNEYQIVGEIHAATPKIYAFQHLLTDLTIVIDPSKQGQGLGKIIFKEFLYVVETSFPHILRVELYTREHNERNVKFYESLGFINEGRQERKIYLSKNCFHTPIHMVWFNPNYDMGYDQK
ncbi:GNAT family N-acetyltransferase [Paradesertivirga mongoliensis]|uniref:GNAT family N-acetyltransferase n=2 Tax=Paradesertivirga mongoliensis TaxID=2100740 RepID=A0ABW4ZLW7_9SPHI